MSQGEAGAGSPLANITLAIEGNMESTKIHVLRVAYVVGLVAMTTCVAILLSVIKGYGERVEKLHHLSIEKSLYQNKMEEVYDSYQDWLRCTTLAMMLIVFCDITGAVAIVSMSLCMLRLQIVFIFMSIVSLVTATPLPFPEYLIITSLVGLLEILIICLLTQEVDRLNKINYIPL